MWQMIQTIRHKGLKRLFEDGDRSRLGADMVDRIERILFILDAVSAVEQMNVPGFHLHPLKGDLQGFHAVTVRANWRIIFRFEGQDAYDVDLLDYH
jgi:proteic killer suppression protein